MVTFEQTPEGRGQGRHAGIWRKSVQAERTENTEAMKQVCFDFLEKWH